MLPIKEIIKSKTFVKCNSCEKICRPWQLETVYDESQGFRTALGACRHCKAVSDYAMRDYTDEEISTIPDIIEIKKKENEFLKEI